MSDTASILDVLIGKPISLASKPMSGEEVPTKCSAADVVVAAYQNKADIYMVRDGELIFYFGGRVVNSEEFQKWATLLHDWEYINGNWYEKDK